MDFYPLDIVPSRHNLPLSNNKKKHYHGLKRVKLSATPIQNKCTMCWTKKNCQIFLQVKILNNQLCEMTKPKYLQTLSAMDNFQSENPSRKVLWKNVKLLRSFESNTRLDPYWISSLSQHDWSAERKAKRKNARKFAMCSSCYGGYWGCSSSSASAFGVRLLLIE